ncbi:unnamed protein product [Chondrus crispus]|uniref:Uncharacterized protein n=1 Tax=Chondrus crispus TaxID=2769 RepID=R7Q907_CHOCR|nr:unnamed protein product [Chondrus crispus]CDF34524.1 unnamed protein product [Chondrus crispus]|eukprot:XP_005714343.1 unnamed protein product [Chondrus crispus]
MADLLLPPTRSIAPNSRPRIGLRMVALSQSITATSLATSMPRPWASSPFADDKEALFSAVLALDCVVRDPGGHRQFFLFPRDRDLFEASPPRCEALARSKDQGIVQFVASLGPAVAGVHRHSLELVLDRLPQLGRHRRTSWLLTSTGLRVVVGATPYATLASGGVGRSGCRVTSPCPARCRIMQHESRLFQTIFSWSLRARAQKIRLQTQ